MKKGRITFELPEQWDVKENDEKPTPPPPTTSSEWNDILKCLVSGQSVTVAQFEEQAMRLFQSTNFPPSMQSFHTNLMMWKEFHRVPIQKPPIATKSGVVRNAWTGEIYDISNPLRTKKGKREIIRVACILNPSQEECQKYGMTEKLPAVQIVVSQEQANILQAHHTIYHLMDYLKAVVAKATQDAKTTDWKTLTGKQHDKPVSKWAWAGSTPLIKEIVKLRKLAEKLTQ